MSATTRTVLTVCLFFVVISVFICPSHAQGTESSLFDEKTYDLCPDSWSPEGRYVFPDTLYFTWTRGTEPVDAINYEIQEFVPNTSPQAWRRISVKMSESRGLGYEFYSNYFLSLVPKFMSPTLRLVAFNPTSSPCQSSLFTIPRSPTKSESLLAPTLYLKKLGSVAVLWDDSALREPTEDEPSGNIIEEFANGAWKTRYVTLKGIPFSAVFPNGPLSAIRIRHRDSITNVSLIDTRSYTRSAQQPFTTLSVSSSESAVVSQSPAASSSTFTVSSLANNPSFAFYRFNVDALPAPFSQNGRYEILTASVDLDVKSYPFDFPVLQAYTNLDRPWEARSIDFASRPVPSSPGLVAARSTIQMPSSGSTLVNIPLDKNVESTLADVKSWILPRSPLSTGLFVEYPGKNSLILSPSATLQLDLGYPVEDISFHRTRSLTLDLCAGSYPCCFSGLSTPSLLFTDPIGYGSFFALSLSFDADSTGIPSLNPMFITGSINGNYAGSGRVSQGAPGKFSFSSQGKYRPEMGGFPNYLYGQSNNFTLVVEGQGQTCISSPLSATFHYYGLCPSGSCSSGLENSCTSLVCVASVCRESTTTPCPTDNCMISQCLDGACLPPVSKCTPPSNPCQVNECVDNECVVRNATDGLVCDSGDVCLTGSCSAGQCVTAPLVCDDGDPCTEETCFANRGCLLTNIIAGCGAQPSPSNIPRPTPTPGSGSIPSPSPTPSTSPFGCFGTSCQPQPNPTVSAPKPNIPVLSSDGSVIGIVKVPPGVKAPVVITPTDPNLLDKANQNNPKIKTVSSVLDITINGGFNGEIEICLTPDQAFNKDKGCLGFIDEENTNPNWKCQDTCLQKKGGLYCGKTNHLTNFAILLGGQDSNDPCNKNANYFTGNALGDGLTVLGIALLILLIALLLIVAVTFFRPFQLLLYGKEGIRAHDLNMRRKSSNFGTDVEMNTL